MKRVDEWEQVIAVALARAKNEPISAYRTAADLDKLQKLARTLTRYYEWFCNEDISWTTCTACGGKLAKGHIYTQCAYAKVERIEETARGIGDLMGLYVETQRDPRGPAVKVYRNAEDAKEGRAMLAWFS